MSLTILSVAYPLAPVSLDSVGGAEQVLATLDRALVQAGHHSIVVAQEGSRVDGTLVPIPVPCGMLDETAKAEAQAANAAATTATLARWPVDLIHLHGIDFSAYLPPPGVPALATLHLPPAWYPAAALNPARPDTWLHCVSQAQHESCPPGLPLLPPIENGIDVAAFAGRHAKRGYALMLGRICPEKGVHLALEAAHKAGTGLLVAGEVFPYAEHQRYFSDVLTLLFDRHRRFLGPVGFARKRRLLAGARCLLVPSLAPETSSLVAREALASGTPVIAFPNGALRDAVEHGRTGFLVEDADGMAAAIRAADTLDPETCRMVARERFPLDLMVAAYFELYARLADRQAPRLSGAA